MRSVYEVIDALRLEHRLTGRALAQKAGINPPTYTAFMARRPPSISKKHLVALAEVFDLKWYDLVNHPGDHAADPERDYKMPTSISDEDFNAVIGRYCSERVIEMMEKEKGVGVTERGAAPNEGRLFDLDEEAARAQYRRSIYFMTAKLNTKGIMRAMQQVLALCDNPEFCFSETIMEEKEWQKEKLPMAADQLRKEQTGDMKDDM